MKALPLKNISIIVPALPQTFDDHMVLTGILARDWGPWKFDPERDQRIEFDLVTGLARDFNSGITWVVEFDIVERSASSSRGVKRQVV